MVLNPNLKAIHKQNVDWEVLLIYHALITITHATSILFQLISTFKDLILQKSGISDIK